VQQPLKIGFLIATATTGSGKNKAVPIIKSAVLLGGHRHNHDEHGGCCHDRISVCCCHNMLLYKDDVQFGVFTPFRATLFS
jgi:hypothetical protein